MPKGNRLQVSRRGFLKTAGVLAGAGAVGTGALSTIAAIPDEKAIAGEEEEKKTVCCIGNCGGGCILEATVRDGKVCSIKNRAFDEIDENRESMCQRGNSHAYRLYSTRRILYPMRRVGERGEGRFERISWDDAIAEICEKWRGYRGEYGGGSIAVFGGSGCQAADGTADFGAGAMGYVSRLISYINGSKIILDADSAGMGSMGSMFGVGLSLFGNDWADLKNADNIIVWGSNPTESQVVRYRHVTQAQAAGAKLTVIDPNFTITASKADRFVSIRPGSDGLLAIAIMRIILRDNLQDESFLKAKSCAPFLVKDSDGLFLRLSDLGKAVRGEEDDLPVMMDASGNIGTSAEIADPVITNAKAAAGDISVRTAYDLLVERVVGGEWTTEQICEYTDVDEPTIEELAKIVTAGKTTVITAYGPDHYANGHTFYANVLTMLMLSGNVGKHGAGIVGGDVSKLTSLAGGDVSKIVAPTDEGVGECARIPANSLQDVLESGRFGDKDLQIKSVYAQACNIIGNQSDRQRWINQILPQIEFFVVSEIEANDTTKYADILLPAAHWWECERFWTNEGYTAMSEQVSQPAGEAKGDIEIFNLLLEGMGFADKQVTREEFNRHAFDNEASAKVGVSWDALKEHKIIKTVEDGTVAVNGLTADSINTAVGRFTFYREGCRPDPDIPGQEWDYNKERLPYWEPPHEAWIDTAEAKKYPLQFMSERAKFKVHTMFSYCQNLLEVMPEPCVTVSPVDAKERNIASGDYVRVYNDRGYVVAKVVVNSGNRPGIVQMDHGWQDEQFKEGHYQDLTSYYSRNVFANNCYHDCMVEMAKAE